MTDMFLVLTLDTDANILLYLLACVLSSFSPLCTFFEKKKIHRHKVLGNPKTLPCPTSTSLPISFPPSLYSRTSAKVATLHSQGCECLSEGVF